MRKDNLNELLNITDAAKEIGISRQRMTELLDDGRIKFLVISDRRFIARRDARAYKPAPVGRPLKKLSPKAKGNGRKGVTF